MRAGRWTALAFVSLALAVVPGALQLVRLDQARTAPTAASAAPELAAPGLRPPRPTVASETSLTPTTTPPPSTVASAVPPAPALAPTATAPHAGAGSAAVPPPDAFVGTAAASAGTPAAFTGGSAGRPGDVVALVVGINDYPGDRYDLSAAVPDANTVTAALDHFGVPAGNRVVLRDGQATRANLVGALRSLAERAGPGTTMVFAYSGHVRKVDRDTEEIVTADGGSITDVELARLLAPARAEQGWLLMAACFGGGFTEALAPGRVLTAAAGASSLAYESPSINGSYLVHHMVREGWLRGKAGPSVQEAFAYADAAIAKTQPDRRPVQLDRSRGRLLLGPAPTAGSGAGSQGGSPSPATTTTTEPERRCSLLVLCRRG